MSHAFNCLVPSISSSGRNGMEHKFRAAFLIFSAGAVCCLDSCVSIYIAPPPAEFTVLETEVEKGRRALADMRSIGTGIESYAVDTNRYPEIPGAVLSIGRFELKPLPELATQLKTYIRSMPIVDPWGHPYLYCSSGQAYAVVSTGADGVVTDPVTLGRLLDSVASSTPVEPVRSSCLEHEIVFASGQFIAWPQDPVKRCQAPVTHANIAPN